MMRGLYDPLLKWPFNQRVVMTLVNQSGGKHVSDYFCPDIRSSSFQQPINRYALGIPTYIYKVFAQLLFGWLEG